MKYIKTYELFGLFKKTNLDPDTIKDLIDSDMDDLVFNCSSYPEIKTISKVDISINTSSCKLESVYYKSNLKGHPILEKGSWSGTVKEWGSSTNISETEYEYATPTTFRDSRLSKRKGLALDVNNILDANNIKDELNTRSMTAAFMLCKFMYDNINKDRLKGYGIGCCMFYDVWPSKILFYNL